MMKMIRSSLLLAALALGLTHSVATAAIIGVDFGSAGNVVTATDSAGAAPFAQTNYNAITASATGTILKDNTGAATTAALTTTGASFAFINSPTTVPDELFNKGVAFAGASWTFTITGIPYSNYTLVVYDLSDTGNVQGIAVGATTFFTSSPNPASTGYIDNNASTPFLYTPSSGTTSGTATPLSDYVLFTGLSGASQTVTISSFSGSDVRSVGGFQIVQVPEPSTWTLAAVALPALLGLRRRRA